MNRGKEIQIEILLHHQKANKLHDSLVDNHVAQHLSLKTFRNYKETKIDFNPKLNVF